MYESPINLLVNDITDNMIKRQEEQLMVEIKKTVGYVIDKKELIKALQYDRGQYEKGYADGVTSATKTGHWIAYEVQLPDRVVLNYHCSVCGRKLVGYSTETLKDAPYCHCGARMEG